MHITYNTTKKKSSCCSSFICYHASS